MNVPRDEVLIHRILEGEASRADWTELELIAEHDREVWARLAQGLQAETLLRTALEQEVAVADSVELPRAIEPVPVAAAQFRRTAPAWSTLGWAAALLFAVLWGGSLWRVPSGDFQPASPSNSIADEEGERRPESSPPLTTEELFARYVRSGQETGRVVGQLPRVVMDTREITGQEALEVLYVRPVVERMTVDEFYRRASDEHGNTVRMKTPLRQLYRGGSL